ncbi:serine hydrolase domain-containing protein [Flavobacterium sp. KACC 22761]|uniref:serine hydrolase domain-containing protein n=1 Tax=Flavobacterium sp. KACC 22761 TaxID=3092665 RepID=UPI002A7632CA|nr:serine hydrolase domain-containing protein [Flavobacterium sp. KACC 22761]WPO78357.1 serine hydrolase domain-containing protein [Flavobacterium sp. KACC 22761]
MKKIILIINISFLIIAIAKGQSKDDKQLIKNLDELLSEKFITASPGCVVLVAKKGEVVYRKAFGSANLELNVPMKPEMVFKLGSITKQFTAVAILQLVEQGKISLQDSLQKFVPDFPSKSKKITVENLLTHTSGIRDYMQIDYQEPNLERRDFDPKELIDHFKNFPLEFEPGTKYKYSNSGYFLLGYIIEKVSGKSYKTYLQENILKPLNLNQIYFDTSNAIIPNRVSGYRKEGSEFKNADYWSMTIAYAAGELISNADDLLKWNIGLYSCKILKKETLDKAFVPFKLKDGSMTEYGYGWILKNINGIKSIEHGGAITGFLSNEIYFPEEDVFVATLFNCECAPKDELSVDIASIALGKTFQNEVKIDDALLNEYLGTYTLSKDTKRTIVIIKENGHLLAKISGQGTVPLIFQSNTKFQFKNILDAECEFIKENGKVTKFNVSQNGNFEWKKKQ